MYLYTQPDRNYKLLQNTILCIRLYFPRGEDTAPAVWKGFKKLHIPTSGDFVFVKVKAQMFHSRVLQHKAVTPVSSAELCSYSRVDPSRASSCQGLAVFKVSPTTQKCSKKALAVTPVSVDGDGFTLASLTLLGELHRNHCRNLFISTQTLLCIMQGRVWSTDSRKLHLPSGCTLNLHLHLFNGIKDSWAFRFDCGVTWV